MTKGNSARLYVDLMRKSCGAYANWTPPKQVQVGDFGVINKETAEFEVEGNIYDDDFLPELDIKHHYGVERSSPNDMELFLSRGVKQVGFDARIAAKYPPLADTRIKICAEFTKDSGASLLLYLPEQHSIRRAADLLPKLQHHDLLANKALVTSVFACPMYSLLLKDQGETSAEIAIGLSLVDSSSESTRGRWMHYNVSGIDKIKTGGEKGDAMFYPLYTLQTPKTRTLMDKILGRRRTKDPEGEDTFYAYPPPWGTLDENGEEIEEEEEEEEQDDN